jgi:hypothetical protein
MTPFVKAACEYVCADHGLLVSQIVGRGRTKDLVLPRQKAMTILSFAGYSYAKIAEIFDGRDHTTTIHAKRRIEEHFPKTYAALQKVTDELMQKYPFEPNERKLIVEKSNVDKSVTITRAQQKIRNLSRTLERAREALTVKDQEIDRLNRALQTEKNKTGTKTETSRMMSRADRAYGVTKLHNRIEELEIENEWLREQLGGKVAA